MASKQDYYELLGVARTASDSELKSAYRKLAMQWHPDRNPGSHEAEEKFKAISEAYAVLSDPDKRSAYDRFGHAAVSGAGPAGGGGFGGFPFDDLFSEIFGFGGDGRRSAGIPRGETLRYVLRITLEEAFAGARETIHYARPETCGGCSGTGAEAGSNPIPCPRCGGLGEVRMQQGFLSMRTTCGTCGGAGRVIEKACHECDGEGRVMRDKEVIVTIPAGVESGNILRVTGGGGTIRGGNAGDLQVVIEVLDHETFKRKGRDLYCRVPVSFTQAALGAELTVETLDGLATVSIPEGTQTGSVFRLRGKGMPVLSGGSRGDLIVETVIRTPTKLSKEARDLLERFEAELSGKPAPEKKAPEKKKKGKGKGAMKRLMAWLRDLWSGVPPAAPRVSGGESY